MSHKKNSLSINPNLLNNSKKGNNLNNSINNSINNSVDDNKFKNLHNSQSNPAKVSLKQNSSVKSFHAPTSYSSENFGFVRQNTPNYDIDADVSYDPYGNSVIKSNSPLKNSLSINVDPSGIIQDRDCDDNDKSLIKNKSLSKFAPVQNQTNTNNANNNVSNCNVDNNVDYKENNQENNHSCIYNDLNNHDNNRNDNHHNDNQHNNPYNNPYNNSSLEESLRVLAHSEKSSTIMFLQNTIKKLDKIKNLCDQSYIMGNVVPIPIKKNEDYYKKMVYPNVFPPINKVEILNSIRTTSDCRQKDYVGLFKVIQTTFQDIAQLVMDRNSTPNNSALSIIYFFTI